MADTISLLSSAGLGAGAMYLLDRKPGRRGRPVARDRYEEASHPRPEAEPHPAEWTESRRMLAGATGGLALTVGMRTGGLFGLAAGATGAWLLARAVTNQPLRMLIGASPDGRAIEFHRTFELEAPPERVFACWDGFGKVPEFMTHVLSVHRLPEGIYRWELDSPAGGSWAQDVYVTQREPNRLLAWRTTEDTVLGYEGYIRFEPSAKGTRVEFRITYRPPRKLEGQPALADSMLMTRYLAARLLGRDPENELREGFERLEKLIASGADTLAEMDELSPMY